MWNHRFGTTSGSLWGHTYSIYIYTHAHSHTHTNTCTPHSHTLCSHFGSSPFYPLHARLVTNFLGSDDADRFFRRRLDGDGHIGQKQIQPKLEKVQPMEKPSGSDAFNLTQELSSCMADSISPPTPQLEGLAQILDNLGKNTGKSVPANDDDGPELPDAKFSDLKLDDPKKQAYIEEAKNAGGFEMRGTKIGNFWAACKADDPELAADYNKVKGYPAQRLFRQRWLESLWSEIVRRRVHIEDMEDAEISKGEFLPIKVFSSVYYFLKNKCFRNTI